MKSKILKIIRVLVILFYIVLTFVVFNKNTSVETDIARGFLNPTIENEKQLLLLSNLSSSNLSVIIETSDYEENGRLKSELENELSKTKIQSSTLDSFNSVISLYNKAPENFLSPKTRNLLLKKDYQSVNTDSFQLLYNPLSFYVQTPDKDPYLFATDYVLNLVPSYLRDSTAEYNEKYYSKIPLKILDKKTFNSDMKVLVDFQNKINKEHSSKIYITGTPIHTYKTSKNSAFEINILCLFSTLALIFLCKKYFKSLKILLPVVSSILFGMISGYLVTSIFVPKIHILTFVFATSLIGISFDYSIHYIFSHVRKKSALKSITISMLTTVLSFGVLCFSKIELLKQIGIFTITGLVSVYLFVYIFLDLFEKNFPKVIFDIKFPNICKFKRLFICVFILIISIGLFRLKFDDNLKSMYSPQKELLNAEVLNNKVFHIPNSIFLVVKGKNTEDILEKEEQISAKLNSQNIDYISLSKFIPSQKRQLENRKLVKDLYSKNLKNYATFISNNSINALNKKIKDNITISPDKSVVENFQIDNLTSYMIVFGKLNINGISRVNKIDVANNFSNVLKSKRQMCIKLLPIIFLIYFGILSLCYNPKKALKIIAGPILGAAFSICFISSFGQMINMFHILSIFLILGFSLDYALFMANDGKSSNPAVFISFISSFISFMLLSFTSFKLISSMGIVLSIGLLISYISSFLLFSKDETENT